jgi:hypothetical protein
VFVVLVMVPLAGINHDGHDGHEWKKGPRSLGASPFDVAQGALSDSRRGVAL